MTKRYFSNNTLDDATPLLQVEDAQAHLIQSITFIIDSCPPTLPWSEKNNDAIYRGFFKGPTSIAYFFLCLSHTQPTLIIKDKLPQEWCQAYLSCGQDAILPIFDKTCGVTNEYLAFNTLKACLTKDLMYAHKVQQALTSLSTNPTYSEWFNGRAGSLYILRLLNHHLPSLIPLNQTLTTSIIQHLLSQAPWTWQGHQYLGPVHGEIGIFTQIILSDPSYAQTLEPKLSTLLDFQDPTGNWPTTPDVNGEYIQFCHGASGFVLSLSTLRPYFPALQPRIDDAMSHGRRLIWEKGLLVKEPCICHGITGNALALEGKEREHFLALATPDSIRQGIEDGVYVRGDESFGCLFGEAGRAWAWMGMVEEVEVGIPMYTDV